MISQSSACAVGDEPLRNRLQFSADGTKLLLIVLLGILIRFLAARFVGHGSPVETFEHERIAQRLLEGGGFALQSYGGTWYRTFGSPPFAYLCAWVYALTGHSHAAMLFVQWLFSAFTCVGCYAISRRLFSPAVGLIAAFLVAMHPGFIFYETHKIHPLSLDAMLAVVGLWMVFLLKDNRSIKMAALCGFVHGLALFERSTQVVLLPLALAAFWQSRSDGWFRRLMAYSFAILAILGPWTLRNICIYHRPVFVTTTSAEVFWRGNNPLASGGAYAKARPGTPVFDAASPEFQQRMVGKDELAQSQIFFDEGVAFVRSHPFETLKLYAMKLYGFWWFSAASGFLYTASYLRIYQGYYAVMLVLAVFGWLVSYRAAAKQQRTEQAMLAFFLFSVTLVQAAFYVEIRHRWGVEPLLLVCSAAGLAALQKLLAEK